MNYFSLFTWIIGRQKIKTEIGNSIRINNA